MKSKISSYEGRGRVFFRAPYSLKGGITITFFRINDGAEINASKVGETYQFLLIGLRINTYLVLTLKPLRFHTGNCSPSNMRVPMTKSIEEINSLLPYSLPRYYQFSRVKVWVLLFLLVTFAFRGQAQSNADYSVHANIIYHFTKYIDWPQYRKEGDFIIGIVGDSPLYEEMKKMMKNKTVGSQTIVVKQLTASQVSFKYHILFVTEEESVNIKKIAGKTASTPVLVVSEQEGLASMGACINFIVVADRLKLEINKNNIEMRNLNIASELLHLGKIVK
jgi:hypothetical protein